RARAIRIEIVIMRITLYPLSVFFFFFFQAEDGIRDRTVTGVQTCALPICSRRRSSSAIRASSRRASRYARVSTNGRTSGRYSYRSEERRVGKECRSRWARCHEKKKKEYEEEREVATRQDKRSTIVLDAAEY